MPVNTRCQVQERGGGPTPVLSGVFPTCVHVCRHLSYLSRGRSRSVIPLPLASTPEVSVRPALPASVVAACALLWWHSSGGHLEFCCCRWWSHMRCTPGTAGLWGLRFRLGSSWQVAPWRSRTVPDSQQRHVRGDARPRPSAALGVTYLFG